MRNRLTMLALAVLLAAPVASAKRVVLKTKDKMKIVADWVAPAGAKLGVMVLLHEYKRHRNVWRPLYAHAAKEGLGILALDMRGHGESIRQGRKSLEFKVNSKDKELFNSMHRDVAAAVAFLKKKGWAANKIVLIGASVGCSVALHYVAEHPKSKIKAGVLMTPGKFYLGIASMKHIQKWGKRPLLLVTTREEADKGAKQLYKVAADRSKAVLLQVNPKNAHGTKMFGKVPLMAERLAEWSAIQLGKKIGP